MRPDSLRYGHCLKVLKQSSLFGGLEDIVLRDMLRIFHYATYNRGETAIAPEQDSDSLYVIISGRAKVSVYNPDSGREHILFLLGPGEGFDLISLLDGDWHDTVATALDDMEILSTTVQQAREWLKRHPDFNRAFLPYLGRQMHGLANQAADLSLYDTEARLARLILRHLASDKSPQAVSILNELSQETIAFMIGSVRVVVTRHLSKWKQKKILSSRHGHWTLLDFQALLEKAGQ